MFTVEQANGEFAARVLVANEASIAVVAAGVVTLARATVLAPDGQAVGLKDARAAMVKVVTLAWPKAKGRKAGESKMLEYLILRAQRAHGLFCYVSGKDGKPTSEPREAGLVSDLRACDTASEAVEVVLRHFATLCADKGMKNNLDGLSVALGYSNGRAGKFDAAKAVEKALKTASTVLADTSTKPAAVKRREAVKAALASVTTYDAVASFISACDDATLDKLTTLIEARLKKLPSNARSRRSDKPVELHVN